jgi:hypothetical protein
MTRVAIMQPTYLPWAGYFGLMQSVDLFIILDSVQFAKRSWQQRNQIKTMNGPLWLTVPVSSKGKRDQLISEVEIAYEGQFPLNHQKSLQMCYQKAPYFDVYGSEILSIIGAGDKYLSSLTVKLITKIKDNFGIKTPIHLSSDYCCEGTKDDLLANLCSQVKATEYVSPPGSRVYLENSNAFLEREIKLSYFEFTHPEYDQRFGDFLPYMSVVDMLFNCGADSALMLLNGNKIYRT